MLYVMGDIHGMYEKYQEMLTRIQFKATDTLYVLGDMIDRGSGSMKVLLDMKERKNVIALCGNHEYMMAQCISKISLARKNSWRQRFQIQEHLQLSDWILNGGQKTINEFQALSEKKQTEIEQYIMNLSIYEEVEVNHKRYILVHAGLGDWKENKKLNDCSLEDFVWKRPNFEKSYYTDKNIYVVVGHTPTLTLTGKAEILHKNNFIAIDCGAYFTEGKLACLCLDTMEEFYV